MTQESSSRTWAFAVRHRPNVARRRKLATRNSIITACSKQAKLLGIRAGMRVAEAKSLVPEIKILVIGGGNV